MRLVGNGIYDNGHHGIVCRTNCVVESNDVAGHSQASVVVEAGANVQVGRSIIDTVAPEPYCYNAKKNLDYIFFPSILGSLNIYP